MTLSHIQYHIGVDWSFTLFGYNFPVFYIGQSSFPIFVYLSAYGFDLSSNKVNFIKRILIYGIIIQVPLLILKESYINIFVTLGLGLLAVLFIENNQHYLTAPIFIFAYFTNLDYGVYGILLMIIAYYCKNKVLLFGFFIIILQYIFIKFGNFSINQWYSIFAIPLLLLYNGELGYRKMKWFFYVYYPLHVAIIVAIANLVNVN